MKVTDEWTEYVRKHPVKSNWMLNELEQIKRLPLCRRQFPYAVCDYVSAGMLHRARHKFKSLKAICGTVNGHNHAWLMDTDDGIYIDFTGRQFESVEYDIMAGSKEDFERAGYRFENEDSCEEVIRSAEENYLGNMLAVEEERAKSALSKKSKKGGRRTRRTRKSLR